MTTQLSILTLIEEGEALRDKGMLKAVKGAENIDPLWSEKALIVFKEYLNTKPVGYSFRTEDVRLFNRIHRKVCEPKSQRAWGSITSKVQKLGLIESRGQVKVLNPDAHRCYANEWVKI